LCCLLVSLCCLLEGSTYRFEGFVLLRHHALVEDVDLLKGSVVHPEEHACNELCHHPPMPARYAVVRG
jgi:hypothetical protein